MQQHNYVQKERWHRSKWYGWCYTSACLCPKWSLETFLLVTMLMVHNLKPMWTHKYMYIFIILPASKEFSCPCFKKVNTSVYKATLPPEECWNINIVFQSNLLGSINSFQQGCLIKRFMKPTVKEKLVLISMYAL